jgi:hypothetical protein
MKRIDIIIPYVLGPNDGMELKYAIRSIEKNFQHDNYRVIVAGDKPGWMKAENHFPFKQIPEQKYRSFTDQLLKLYSVLTNAGISDGFIWTYDDTYFTRPVKLANLRRLKAITSFDTHPRHLDNNGAGSNWKDTLQYTMAQVLKEKGSNHNYETHLPRYFTKARVLKLIEKFDLLSRPMMISSLYFNIHHKNETPVFLYDNRNTIRFLLRSTFDYNTLKKQMNRHQFTNNDPRTWNPVLKKVLMEMFPEKSSCEL